MHYTPAQFAVLAVAFALAATRLLTASRPFWTATPFAKYLTVLGPALLAGFAAVPSAFAEAKSWVDVAVALLMVGSVGFAAAHGKPAPADPGDSLPVAARRLSSRPPQGLDAPLSRLRPRRWLPAWAPAFLALLLFTGCLSHVTWPQLAACAAPLEMPLMSAVANVLAGNGDVEEELGKLTSTYAPSLIECAVQQLVADLGSSPVTARASHQAARGRAFLAKVRAQ